MERIVKLILKIALSIKEDLQTAIQESWNHFDKEY